MPALIGMCQLLALTSLSQLMYVSVSTFSIVTLGKKKGSFVTFLPFRAQNCPRWQHSYNVTSFPVLLFTFSTAMLLALFHSMA